MSFYRIYRPQVIDEIDNPAIREQLASLLSKDKKALPHAFFLTGPKGTGKTTAARVIAKLFNCTKPTKSGPCGKCEQCAAIANGTSLDVIEMDAASNRGIDEIRTLRDSINLAPVSADCTVYIIDEVHMLTTEAFNALLKTLEEPPPHAVFILATTDAHKVPGTIVSRCVHLGFRRAGALELIHVIRRIAKKEKIPIDEEAITLLAQAADGSFRDAAKLLEQVSFHKGNVTSDVVHRLLRITEENVRAALLACLLRHDTKGSLSLVSDMVSEGRDIKEFITDLLGDLHGMLLATSEGQAPQGWTSKAITDLIRRLTTAFGELRYSPIPSLPVELAIVEFCSAPDEEAPSLMPPPTPSSARSGSRELSSLGLLTLEKLIKHWPDFIAATKPFNHSVAGVLRSSRPKAIENGIVTIEAFYKFHQEKLQDARTREALADVLKKLFGEKVTVEIVLGKK